MSIDKKETKYSQSSSNDSFMNHLKKATDTVKSWPEWKQNILGAATPEQRKKNGSSTPSGTP